jgi:hypothetical protein
MNNQRVLLAQALAVVVEQAIPVALQYGSQ